VVQHSRLRTNDKQTPVRSKADVTAFDSEAAYLLTSVNYFPGLRLLRWI